MNCSIIWRRCLIKHVQVLERVQRHVTKYISNDYVSEYKSCLIKLQILRPKTDTIGEVKFVLYKKCQVFLTYTNALYIEFNSGVPF